MSSFLHQYLFWCLKLHKTSKSRNLYDLGNMCENPEIPHLTYYNLQHFVSHTKSQNISQKRRVWNFIGIKISTLKKQEPFRCYDKSFIFLLSLILLCFPPNIIKILQFRHSTELAVPMQVDNKKKYLWIWSNKQENWTAW